MTKRRAFTLIELLIASTIYVVIIVGIYSSFHTGIFGYGKIEDKIRSYQAAARILERIDLDLRNSFSFSEKETKFTADKDSISFLTILDIFQEDNINQEYCFVSYNLSGNSLMRLSKRGKDSLNEAADVKSEEMNPDIQEFNLSYGIQEASDEPFQWRESWDDAAFFPDAIKVELVIKDKTQEKFMRTIYLTFSK